MTDREPSCEQRVEEHLNSRIQDLKKLWKTYCRGEDDEQEGNLCDYGLCFDYVAPETFREQREGYFRYQLSYGGPSDEFRFYTNPDFPIHRIEYWFLDWFDGAHRTLSDSDEEFMQELWAWFSACDLPRHEFEKATKI